MIRIGFVGGGTGGHFYPLIAIAEKLRDSGESVNFYYFGPGQYDAEALGENNITFIYCPAGKQRRYFSLLNIVDFFKVLFGMLIIIPKLLIIYPDVIISKGGYTSVPIVFGAWLLRIPIVIHESDAVPGKANKFAKRFARYIAISYDDAAQFFPAEKTALTGIPIRKSFFTDVTDEHKQALGVTLERPSILVLGGSLGAERINNLILKTLDELLPTYNIIHQTGNDHFDTVRESASALIEDTDLLINYHPVPFLPAGTLHAAMSVASIIISRAGSTLIYETALHGKPSILIPIPEDISHDQRTNAYAYARDGGAIVMEEGNLSDSLLAAEISRIMGNPEEYQQMSRAASAFPPPDAAQKIAEMLIGIGKEHE